MSNFSFVAPGASSALVYNTSGGTLLATVPCPDSSVVTLQLAVEKAFIILRDASGRTMMSTALYQNMNYLFPTVALPSGVTTDAAFPAAVRQSGGVKELLGRINHASGDLATILHIAAGYRPSVDVAGVADLNGASVVPVTVTALGDVTMTPASWTSLNLRANFI